MIFVAQWTGQRTLRKSRRRLRKEQFYRGNLQPQIILTISFPFLYSKMYIYIYIYVIILLLIWLILWTNSFFVLTTVCILEKSHGIQSSWKWARCVSSMSSANQRMLCQPSMWGLWIDSILKRVLALLKLQRMVIPINRSPQIKPHIRNQVIILWITKHSKI